jgi:hypothetical protein
MTTQTTILIEVRVQATVRHLRGKTLVGVVSADYRGQVIDLSATDLDRAATTIGETTIDDLWKQRKEQYVAA